LKKATGLGGGGDILVNFVLNIALLAIVDRLIFCYYCLDWSEKVEVVKGSCNKLWGVDEQGIPRIHESCNTAVVFHPLILKWESWSS